MAVSVLMAAGPVAYAASEGGNTEGGKGYKNVEGKGFMKELNLTPEQREKLKVQREASKESHKAVREQMKSKMQALHEAIAKPETKRADVEGLVNEVNALKAQMFAQKIDGMFAMKEVLTPEQFSKMQAKHKERMEKMREKHKAMMGKGGKGNEEPEQDLEQD